MEHGAPQEDGVVKVNQAVQRVQCGCSSTLYLVHINHLLNRHCFAAQPASLPACLTA
jgi:hypothetical protein